jgi:hypothetical protein
VKIFNQQNKYCTEYTLRQQFPQNAPDENSVNASQIEIALAGTAKSLLPNLSAPTCRAPLHTR